MNFQSADQFVDAIVEKLKAARRKTVEDASNRDMFYAVSAIVKERINSAWVETQTIYKQKKVRQIYYLSMEFLIGRLLESNLLNCGLLDICNEALTALGFQPKEVYAAEHDAGLGNGGLGRLAACFLDSMASLQFPGHGCGIRYRYGLFEQRIIQGNQIELPDYWLKEEYPWETRKDEEAVEVQFGGEVEMLTKIDGSLEFRYHNTDKVMAVPYDIAVVGYHNKTINTLRLWSAESPDFEQNISSQGGAKYYHELEHQHSIEQISGFLYPDDSVYEGKLLRLKQQYFLVAASLKSILSSFKKNYRLPLTQLQEKVVVQINDTHPSLAIPEFMRILMDEERFGWDDAWKMTQQVFAYTNHTTLSEALEKWPVEMMKQLLPRIYMIIHEMNERFCKNIWFDHPELRDELPGLAIIADNQIHMARMAVIGSFSVNGVARIHTDILKNQEMKHFYTLFPDRFRNKTNGITHRRWLLQVNPRLAGLVSDTIGKKWVKQPSKLISLLRYSKDASFLNKIDDVKKHNKQLLSSFIYTKTGIMTDPASIFDVQIKRLHEYKRQLLNIFHVIHLYNELKDNPAMNVVPRTFIFGAKAAPSYHLAKEIIKLINQTAFIINNDKTISEKLKVVFLENYNVSLAEHIIPAADISEQISTASKEASGTGNMKMMMNGAITLGTLDGANIEIKALVGEKNMFIFGLTAEEVLYYYQHGGYVARDIYEVDERVRRILDQLNDGAFGSQEMEFKDIYYNILSHNDPYFVLKDFDSYIEAHELVEQAYRDRNTWLSMSVTNIAYSGKFSSDRTIQEYASEIWRVRPIKGWKFLI
ncbi:starch phosphorylase [Evansella caseinilytica]|uniref:Alpha-1,4 glucan phosphorylase n=1 Tax=Evansella caseinilytica TaxID=1503961 RepID=A0A1H3PF41_9BACI|nr:glycogen/starch/alpha-glucan phosphorylase [Evansella caseinilytica]SDY99700.1 starch phosphorylase [Evansella caseinilytica]